MVDALVRAALFLSIALSLIPFAHANSINRGSLTLYGPVRVGEERDFRPFNLGSHLGNCLDLRLSEYLDALGGAKLFSSLKLASGYCQVAMKPEHRLKKAFTTLFVFTNIIAFRKV